LAPPEQTEDANLVGTVGGSPRTVDHGPGFVRQKRRARGGVLRCHLDHTTIGLYIAYILPDSLRWRTGDSFQPGVWALGKHYRWVNAIAIVWVILCVIIFCAPGSPGAVPWDKGFSWSDFNYAQVVTIALALGVWTAWEAGAKHTFEGPVRALDEPDVGTSDDPALMPAD
jgi:hypothetical protein